MFSCNAQRHLAGWQRKGTERREKVRVRKREREEKRNVGRENERGKTVGKRARGVNVREWGDREKK